MTGLKFEVAHSDYEEDMSMKMEPHKLARFLSDGKAASAAGRHKNALVIAADTFIVFKGRLMGKPHTSEEAKRMLNALNGKSHSVITGFTIIDAKTGKKLSRSVETKVWLKKMTASEIDGYVKTGEPLDKAGAYAIQGLGAVIVKKIEGDYLNVVGLPLYDVVDALGKLGVKVFKTLFLLTLGTNIWLNNYL
jgi:septum formation protein